MRSSCRWVFAGIVLLSLFLWSRGTLFGAGARKDSLALVHFRKGEEYALQGDTTRAIEEFKKAVWWNRKLSSAHHRLAQLYLGLGTLYDRIRARRVLDEALRLDPKNVSYLHTQVQLFLRIGFFGSAERVLKELIKIDPKDAEAYFTLGLIAEKDWFRYRDMISPQGDGVVLSLSDFADKDLGQAIGYYRKVLETDSQFSGATYRLALLYYEMNDLDRMVALLQDALRTDTKNKDYHLFLGLAYHRMRCFEDAWVEYEQAKSLMGDKELALFEAVDLISTPEEGKLYSHSNKEGKEKIQYAFWKRKDPLFLTEMNERKLEHYGRIAYVNLRFSRVHQGVEGWRTDQGKVLIRYGPPESQYKTRPWVEVSSGSGGNPLRPSQAVWSYPGFQFVFEDRYLNENYTFSWGVNGPDYLDLFDRMIREQPERYDYVPWEYRFRVSCSSACFRGKEGRSVLEVYQAIPRGNVEYPLDWKRLPLKRGVFLFDQNWKEVREAVIEKPILTLLEGDSLIVGWDRMEVFPGTYHLAVEFLEQREGRVGRWLEDVTVEAFDHSRLAMSDVVLARDISDYEEERALRRGGVQIVPNPLQVYPVASSIPLYFEIYNLTYSPGGYSHYRVTFIVTSGEKRNRLSQFVHQLLRRRKASPQVATSYEYYGEKRDENFHQTLTLEGPRPQEYRLRVEVEDINTGQSVYKERVFRLRESSIE